MIRTCKGSARGVGWFWASGQLNRNGRNGRNGSGRSRGGKPPGIYGLEYHPSHDE